jgi:OmpA-OmpF porin, OOP family
VRICKDQPVTLAQALDNQPNGQGINNPREITFMCGTPPAPAPAPVAQAPTPAPPPMPAPAPRHVVLQGDTNFATGSATLTATAQRQLNDFLAASQGAHFTNTQISGYTDSTGSAASNQRLSQARAESVARYLGARGLQSDKIVAQGFGASNPVASNSTAEGRAQNRRVEINVTATQ